jgi:putative tricarboxylic transport membrane protein
MTNARTRRPGELAFIVLLTIFSLLAAWQAWLISGFSSPSSPGMFPMFATFTMVVSGIAILADTARKRRYEERSAVQAFMADVTPVRLLVFAAMIIGYMLLLEPAGFLISSFAFLFASMAFLYRGSILVSLVTSAFSLAVIFVLFRHVFSVVLPAGRIF